jgi:alpha-L-arabinofuranosidase
LIAFWIIAHASLQLFLTNNFTVLAVWSGHALDGEVVSQGALEPYVEDVMNELEFLMGSVDTTYGALRAAYGHPEPWNIKYVEVGNEDMYFGGYNSYISYRFSAFYDAITKQYPGITVIASFGFSSLPGTAASDFHEYASPDAFVSQFNMFDSTPKTHKVLIGE